MAFDRNITSTNSTLALAATNIFPIPQTIFGFSPDAALAFPSIDIAETQMGVDCYMSAGYRPAITPFVVTLQADSPSVDFFEAVLAAMKVTKNIIYLSGTASYPGLGKKVSLSKGVLQHVQVFSDAKQVMQALEYTIHFESSLVTPL